MTTPVDPPTDDATASPPAALEFSAVERTALREPGSPESALDVDAMEPLPPGPLLYLVKAAGGLLRCECGETWPLPATVAAIWQSAREHLFIECPIQTRAHQAQPHTTRGTAVPRVQPPPTLPPATGHRPPATRTHDLVRRCGRHGQHLRLRRPGLGHHPRAG